MKCAGCGTETLKLNGTYNEAGLCQACNRKAYIKAYHKTDKYKAYQKAYRKTEKYKAYNRAYMRAYRQRRKAKEAKDDNTKQVAGN